MVDQIGGWATAGVGQGYGEGYNLKSVRYCLEKLEYWSPQSLKFLGELTP